MTTFQLSEQAIKDFKRIYFEEKGEKISDIKANELGVLLLNFMKLIYKPLPKTFGPKA